MRGYYVDDFSGLQEFPVGERYGSSPHDREEGDLVMETERGKRYVYKQFSRRVWRLNFRVTLIELQFFINLHDTVKGQEIPFYFMEDTADSSGSAFYVRKEPHFQPKELDMPAAVDTGAEVPEELEMYDYTLILTEEPTGVEVEA